MPHITIGEILRDAVLRLQSVTDSPHLEAEVLLAHLLERPRVWLLAHPEAALTAAQATHYTAWLARRDTGEPLPYITGLCEFYGLTFAVTPAVLIPRPETELLVETALHWIHKHPIPARQLRAVDAGTGSGCIAVTLAHLCPDLHLYATDSSAAALEVARANAARHAVANRLTFLHGDWLTPLPEPVMLILSNPPYIADCEWDALPRSVQQEPRSALLAGADGLDALRQLLAQARIALLPGGLLLAEIGATQANAAQALAHAAFPSAYISIIPDLNRKNRLLKIGLFGN